MKTRNLWMTVFLVIAGSFTVDSFAQENLKKLLKDYENMDGSEVVVQVTTVRNKDKTAKKQIRTTTHIQLNATPELEKKIIEIFRKDSEKATDTIEQKKNGRLINMNYRFESSTYSYTISDNLIEIVAVEESGLSASSI